MRVELDPSFSGDAGMLHVWNATDGAIQVTEAGHLLNAKTSAWVTENSVLLEVVELGQAVILSDAPAKKNGKKSKQSSDQPQPSVQDQSPVAQSEQPAAPEAAVAKQEVAEIQPHKEQQPQEQIAPVNENQQ